MTLAGGSRYLQNFLRIPVAIVRAVANAFFMAALNFFHDRGTGEYNTQNAQLNTQVNTQNWY